MTARTFIANQMYR